MNAIPIHNEKFVSHFSASGKAHAEQAQALAHEAEGHRGDVRSTPSACVRQEKNARVVEIRHQVGSTSAGSVALSVAARRSKVSGKGARFRQTRPMVRPGGGDLNGRISTDFLI